MVDLSVYDKITTIDKERQKNRDANLREDLAIGKLQNTSRSANKLPAALQLANEYEQRIQMGDVDGANNLAMFAKTQDKNIYRDAEGIIRERAGIGQALGSIGQQTKFGEQVGTQRAKDIYEPQRAGNVAQAKIQAKSTGEATNLLAELNANMPKLEGVKQRLSELGGKATYTTAGKLRDSALRQMGMDMSEGGIARAEYISRVDNEVLPLLRQTFGAAFTEREGETLKKTLGDPDASPEEKDARLNAFIEQKVAQVQSLQRQLGQSNQPLTQENNLRASGLPDEYINQSDQIEDMSAQYSEPVTQPQKMTANDVYMQLRNKGYSDAQATSFIRQKGLK